MNITSPDIFIKRMTLRVVVVKWFADYVIQKLLKTINNKE